MNTPTITFNTQAEADQWGDTLFQNITNKCKNIFVNDNFEYNYAKNQGLTERQRIVIISGIENALRDIFPDSHQWCYEQAGNIGCSVDELSETLIESNIWPDIYASRSKEQIFDLFMGHVIRKLENDVLDDVMDHPWLHEIPVIDNTEDIEILI